MEDLIILILIGFGTALGCLILWKVFDIVRSSIKGNKITITEEDFDRLARAFIQHKKEMQKRVQNLEAVLAEEKGENNYSQIEVLKGEGSLTNDLQEKDKVRS
jgi:hypothetical protein